MSFRTHFLPHVSPQHMKGDESESIQGDCGPENVDTTEAVSSLRWETRPGRANIFCPRAFLPSFIKDMPWVPEFMLFGPNCWRPSESLLFRGMALLKPPFTLLVEVRLALELGLVINKFSCSTATWLWTFFISWKENLPHHVGKNTQANGPLWNEVWFCWVCCKYLGCLTRNRHKNKNATLSFLMNCEPFISLSNKTNPLSLLILLLFLP